MPQEQALRGCLAFLFLGLLILWLWNLRRVGVTRDVFYSANEGWLLALLIRLLAGLSLASIALYLLSPAWMSWSQLSLAMPLRWLGAPVGLAGIALFAWVLLTLGRGFSMSITIRDRQSLIREGPYRWVRHPMYGAFIVLWLSFSLLTANWFVAATGVAAFAMAMLVRTPKEEALLIQAFGDEYREYRRHTGRYLPRFRSGSGRSTSSDDV